MVQKRQMAMEIAGHAFWAADGKTMWYDFQTPVGEVFWLAGYNAETHQRIWYHLQRDEWSIHYNVSEDGTLFCGDGSDPALSSRGAGSKWIELFRPELTKVNGVNGPDLIQPGVLRTERLVNMTKHNYRLEPNSSFTPDGKMVIFTSNMFGPSYLFGVEIKKP
jgi:oligogalacturonide lyase